MRVDTPLARAYNRHRRDSGWVERVSFLGLETVWGGPQPVAGPSHVAGRDIRARRAWVKYKSLPWGFSQVQVVPENGTRRVGRENGEQNSAVSSTQ